MRSSPAALLLGYRLRRSSLPIGAEQIVVLVLLEFYEVLVNALERPRSQFWNKTNFTLHPTVALFSELSGQKAFHPVDLVSFWLISGRWQVPAEKRPTPGEVGDSMLKADHSLLERCIRRDSAAQFELYKVLRDLLLSIARRYEHDDLQRRAMVNTAFLKILDNLHTRNLEAPFEAWCRRIMINTVLTELRHRRTAEGPIGPRNVDLSNNLHAVEVNGAEEVIQTEALQHMMDRLPTVTRQVFNLYAIDGWKHKEIAASLGIGEGTSKWHVSHARQVLQEMLKNGVRTHLNLRIA